MIDVLYLTSPQRRAVRGARTNTDGLGVYAQSLFCAGVGGVEGLLHG